MSEDSNLKPTATEEAMFLQGTELDDAMKSTLDRRWQEIESGTVQCLPHEEGMARLRAKYNV